MRGSQGNMFEIGKLDGSPAMRTFVCRISERSRCDFSARTEASNGQETLTENNISGTRGEEYLRRVSADEFLHSIPVTVISDDGTGKRMPQMLALGARGYIVNPFTQWFYAQNRSHSDLAARLNFEVKRPGSRAFRVSAAAEPSIAPGFFDDGAATNGNAIHGSIAVGIRMGRPA
jgi:hypothetical protein